MFKIFNTLTFSMAPILAMFSNTHFNDAKISIANNKIEETYNLNDNATGNISPHFYNWLNWDSGDNNNNWNYVFKNKKNINVDVSDIEPNGNVRGGIKLKMVNNSFNAETVNLYQNGNIRGIFNEASAKELSWQPDPDHGYPYQVKKDYTISQLTPDNGGVNKQINNIGAKSFVQSFINNELNFWYYSTFKNPLEFELPDYSEQMQKYQAIRDKMYTLFDNLLNFSFGGAYNSEVKHTISDNSWANGAEAFSGFLSDSAALALEGIAPWAGFAAWGLNTIIDGIFHMPSYSSKENYYQWNSIPLTLGTLDGIFSDILGTPQKMNQNSVISKYKAQNNNKFPGIIRLNNFEFDVKNFRAYSQEWDQLHSLHSNSIEFNQVGENIQPVFSLDISVQSNPNKYSAQKKRINDPYAFDKDDPMRFSLGGLNEIKASDWDITMQDSFRAGWAGQGAISSDLDNRQDVSFVPIDLIKGQKVIVKMKCPALGYDGDPNVPASYKYFYVLPE